MDSKEYVQVSELAKKFDISSHTIRRKIQDGKIFPGAKKESKSFGEMWMIPKEVAESVSLKEISPKVYQERHKNRMLSLSSEVHTTEVRRDTNKIKELEERINLLERAVLKLSM